ncbi:MAG: DUF2975 domain-containing protein [Parvularculaceae bacterium]
MSSQSALIRRASLAFLVVIPLAAAATLVLPVIYWGFGGYNFGDNTLVLAATPPREGARWLGFLVGVPSTAAWVYALVRLHRLFLKFRRGAFIDAASARDLRAYSFFAIVAVFFDVATSGARRWAMGEHDAPFWTHININTEHLALAFTAGVFMIVSFVLVEAERYKTETEQYL